MTENLKVCRKHDPPLALGECADCGWLSRCPGCGCWRVSTGFCSPKPKRGNGLAPADDTEGVPI